MLGIVHILVLYVFGIIVVERWEGLKFLFQIIHRNFEQIYGNQNNF